MYLPPSASLISLFTGFTPQRRSYMLTLTYQIYSISESGRAWKTWRFSCVAVRVFPLRLGDFHARARLSSYSSELYTTGPLSSGGNQRKISFKNIIWTHAERGYRHDKNSVKWISNTLTRSIWWFTYASRHLSQISCHPIWYKVKLKLRVAKSHLSHGVIV